MSNSCDSHQITLQGGAFFFKNSFEIFKKNTSLKNLICRQMRRFDV